MTPSQRIGIISDEIASVVKRFYEQVRQDPDIGPVFKHTVGTSEQVWAHHEEKISAFWRNALLHERGYDGNPMLAHMGISSLMPRHFDVWLGLFEHTLFLELNSEKAEIWLTLAHRIGRGLRMGITAHKMEHMGPPDLS